MSTRSFSQCSLSAAQLSNLESLGYHEMTPIQAAALPGALEGDDLIAQARTGSGKTAVFALALLERIDLSSNATQALVLCPTRELCMQVSTEIRRIVRHQQNVTLTSLYGGQPLPLQKRALKNGAQIVVGTPGRVGDHLERGSLILDNLNVLVLDEADRMLDMGFIKDINKIVVKAPEQRQTLLFSATYPDIIQQRSAHIQNDPQRVIVDEPHASEEIEQHVYFCPEHDKLNGVKRLLLEYQPAAAVIFCNLKQSTLDICNFLQDSGIEAVALNGDLEQREREDILMEFKHRSCSVLVATDVAARGLDIKDLPLVINYEIPSDPEIYVHRIGRTGRAGKSGIALSLCGAREKWRFSAINSYQNASIEEESMGSLQSRSTKIPSPTHTTFCIFGGRNAKVRPGEILGALTRDDALGGSEVGKIDVLDFKSYVAVIRSAADRAETQLRNVRIKGRAFKFVRL